MLALQPDVRKRAMSRRIQSELPVLPTLNGAGTQSPAFHRFNTLMATPSSNRVSRNVQTVWRDEDETAPKGASAPPAVVAAPSPAPSDAAAAHAPATTPNAGSSSFLNRSSSDQQDSKAGTSLAADFIPGVGILQAITGRASFTNAKLNTSERIRSGIDGVPLLGQSVQAMAVMTGKDPITGRKLSMTERRLYGFMYDMIPGVSNVKGAIQLFTGKDLATGEKQNWFERSLSGVAALPLAGNALSLTKNLGRAGLGLAERELPSALRLAGDGIQAVKDSSMLNSAIDMSKNAYRSIKNLPQVQYAIGSAGEVTQSLLSKAAPIIDTVKESSAFKSAQDYGKQAMGTVSESAESMLNSGNSLLKDAYGEIKNLPERMGSAKNYLMNKGLSLAQYLGNTRFLNKSIDLTKGAYGKISNLPVVGSMLNKGAAFFERHPQIGEGLLDNITDPYRSFFNKGQTLKEPLGKALVDTTIGPIGEDIVNGKSTKALVKLGFQAAKKIGSPILGDQTDETDNYGREPSRQEQQHLEDQRLQETSTALRQQGVSGLAGLKSTAHDLAGWGKQTGGEIAQGVGATYDDSAAFLNARAGEVAGGVSDTYGRASAYLKAEGNSIVSGLADFSHQAGNVHSMSDGLALLQTGMGQAAHFAGKSVSEITHGVGNTTGQALEWTGKTLGQMGHGTGNTIGNAAQWGQKTSRHSHSSATNALDSAVDWSTDTLGLSAHYAQHRYNKIPAVPQLTGEAFGKPDELTNLFDKGVHVAGRGTKYALNQANQAIQHPIQTLENLGHGGWETLKHLWRS
jgi:hypothetical protein